MTKKRISETYADFVLQQRFENLEPAVVDRIKLLILDCIGVALAGIHLMELPRAVKEFVIGLGGKREASIFSSAKKVPAVNAAFANAVFAHSLDMDDGHRFGALHPGCVIIPASLAAAEIARCSGKKLIEGVYVGYEVMIRIGKAINPSSLNRGFHTTGTTGPFGSAAACGKILGLTSKEIEGALGVAGLQAAGLLRVNHEDEGSKVKPITPGRAASSGLLSVLISKMGFLGPLEIFEGTDGFLKAFADQLDTPSLTDGLGEKHEVLNTYIKLYAACRHCHAPIDAVLEARRRMDFDPLSVNLIEVETYPAAIRLAGIRDVNSPSAARFSIPFSVSLALIKGKAGATDYTYETVRDHKVKEMAEKVVLNVSKKWEKLYPAKRGASVKIVGKDGRQVVAEIELPKGEPENPAEPEDIIRKFQDNVALFGGSTYANILCDAILELERWDSIDPIMKIIRKKPK
jgi:2-methylcitrate dehydratase PrpD